MIAASRPSAPAAYSMVPSTVAALAAASHELAQLRAMLEEERTHSAALQQKLEDSRADLREERLRSQV